MSDYVEKFRIKPD